MADVPPGGDLGSAINPQEKGCSSSCANLFCAWCANGLWMLAPHPSLLDQRHDLAGESLHRRHHGSIVAPSGEVEDEVVDADRLVLSDIFGDLLRVTLHRQPVRPLAFVEVDAKTMIVNGFFDAFTKELPMEYAVELNRLLQLQMEGAVG